MTEDELFEDVKHWKAVADARQEEIERMRGLLKQTRNYVDRDHYGMLADIDAALSQQITCRNCKDPIDDGHKEFCGMCREMGCT